MKKCEKMLAVPPLMSSFASVLFDVPEWGSRGAERGAGSRGAGSRGAGKGERDEREGIHEGRGGDWVGNR